MKNENEKKGLFARLIQSDKKEKSSCCCNVEIEEIPDEETSNENEKKTPKDKGSSCCS